MINSPLYVRIANDIKKDISEENYKTGDLLPTEEDLENHFNASRTTIRNAIGLLESEGLVKRKQGKGTIVLGFKTVQKLNYITSFTETLKQKGIQILTGNLSVNKIEAPPKVINALKLKENEEVYLIQRIRIIGKEPIAFVNNYLLAKKIPKLETKADHLNSIGLYQLLEEEYKLTLHRAVETIGVYLSGPLESEILHVPRNFPLFHTVRLTYLDDETAFEYVTSIIRGDKYEYTVYLHSRPPKTELD